MAKKGHIPWNKGKTGVYSEESLQKMSESHKGKTFEHSEETKRKISKALMGHEVSKEARQKMSEAKLRNPVKYWEGKSRPPLSEEHKEKIRKAALKHECNLPVLKGPDHPNWIKDRSKLKKQNRRNDSAYKEWRKKVYARDNWTCKMDNKDCSGRIEAHHILSWSEFPELRYKINNGITLCHAHHPTMRAEEKRMILAFQELLSVSSE